MGHDLIREWDRYSRSTSSLGSSSYSPSPSPSPSPSRFDLQPWASNDSSYAELDTTHPIPTFFQQRALEAHDGDPRRALQVLEDRRQAMRQEYGPARWLAARVASRAPAPLCTHGHRLCTHPDCLNSWWEHVVGRRAFGSRSIKAPWWWNQRDFHWRGGGGGGASRADASYVGPAKYLDLDDRDHPAHRTERSPGGDQNERRQLGVTVGAAVNRYAAVLRRPQLWASDQKMAKLAQLSQEELPPPPYTLDAPRCSTADV